MPELEPHYHVGIIVQDLVASRAKLTDLLGVTWGPVLRLDEVDYRLGGGEDITLPTAFCYSTGSPCLELIEELPGSIWVRNEHSNLHHLGIWVDGLGETSATLGAGGCPLLLSGRDGSDAPTQFAYHRDQELGINIEVVDRSMQEVMAFLFQPDP